MKVAITGSSGFVGNFLKKKLIEEGLEIFEIDLKSGIDILNKQHLEKVPYFDCLVHLAALSFVPDSYHNSRDFYITNLTGTVNALELCKKYQSRMIFMSSYVYGIPQYLPIDENHPLSAFNPYADTKIKGEELCKSYNRFFGIPITIFRPFNIYGPEQNRNFLIPSIFEQIYNKNEIVLKDPNPKRDFVYVTDVVNALFMGIKYFQSEFEIFNIGSGESKSVKEICTLILSSFDYEISLKFTGEQRENEVSDVIANIEKAKINLSWTPQISFEEGIFKLTTIRN